MERKEGSQPKKSLLPSETDREINLAGIEGVLEGNNDIEELEAGGCKAFVDAFDSSCSESENFEDECSSICTVELEAPLGLDCLFVEEMEYAGTRKEQHLQEDNREVASRHYLEDSLGQGDLSKVILKESSSQQDMLKSLFQVNYLYWLERNAGIKSRSACDDCRLGGRLRISLDYVEREFNHVKKDGELAGWITDGLIARPLPSRIRPGYVQFTPAS